MLTATELDEFLASESITKQITKMMKEHLVTGTRATSFIADELSRAANEWRNHPSAGSVYYTGFANVISIDGLSHPVNAESDLITMTVAISDLLLPAGDGVPPDGETPVDISAIADLVAQERQEAEERRPKTRVEKIEAPAKRAAAEASRAQGRPVIPILAFSNVAQSMRQSYVDLVFDALLARGVARAQAIDQALEIELKVHTDCGTREAYRSGMAAALLRVKKG
eukprot:m51a1_g5464 hypothetical protein (226) ;mRNA; f:267098-269074